MSEPGQTQTPVAEPPPPTRADDACAGQGTPSPVLELARLLEGRRGERHVVALQDFPDPDAISSGMAYRELAGAFGITADLMYEGVISHPENLALINLLEIQVIRWTRDVDLERYAA